jgi:hypothetical protein
MPYLGAGTGVFGFLGHGYLHGGRLRQRQQHLARGACCRRARFHVLPYTTLSPPAAAAIMIALGLRYRHDPCAHSRETICAVVVLLTAGAGADVAELRLVLPRAGAVHSAQRGAPAWALTLGAFLLYRPIFFASHNELIWKSLATLPFVLVLAFVLSRKRTRDAVA